MRDKMKKIVILGATGSVGTQALEIIEESARYEIFGITCYNRIERVIELAKRYKPKVVVVYDENQYKALTEALKGLGIAVAAGLNGILELVAHEAVDVVVTAIVGNAGLLPTVKAIEAGKTIALANKETLVTAGHLIMPMAQAAGVPVIPVDSEHSAIFQCLNGEPPEAVDKIILTASGGAFRTFTKAEIAQKTFREALKHPNWSMGAKITIDSATMMNKGLEFIEARWLFNVPPSQIEVLVHPQSIVHSMVQFKDSAVVAQLGVPDMRLPIIYALDYPERHHNSIPKLDFGTMGALTFERPDFERFPCLSLAIRAITEGGACPTVLNAANEVLVEAYLKEQIGFYDIATGVEKAMNRYEMKSWPSLEEILEIDAEVRAYTKRQIK